MDRSSGTTPAGINLVKQKSTLVGRVAALESRLNAVEGATAQFTKLLK